MAKGAHTKNRLRFAAAVGAPESDTLSSVRASYGRLTRLLTAAAEDLLAAQRQTLSGRPNSRPLAAVEQYYRLRLDKMAASVSDGRQVEYWRWRLRRGLPGGRLCALDICCLETRQGGFFKGTET